MKINVVTSAFNEEDNIEELVLRLTKIFENEKKYNWILTIFDNGSTDLTWEKIKNAAKFDSRIRGIKFSRMFNLDHAFAAGIEFSDADALILMASDLQDPPEIIPKFLRRWEEGSLHVVARVFNRDEMSYLRKILTSFYYLFSNWATGNLIQKNVSDFRLMDKKVYESVKLLKEKNRFTRGLISWTGFKPSIVELHRPKRHSGKTKTNYRSLIYFAIKSILANSSKPLNFISIVGILLSFISLIVTFVYLNQWLTKGVPFAGFGTLISLILLTFSFLVFILGLIGQYIVLMYEEIKQRPLYIIEDKIN